MSGVAIHRVWPGEALEIAWPVVRGWIDRALPREPRTHEPGDIRDLVEREQVQLWVAAVDGALAAALVSELVDYPRLRACRVPIIGGVKMRRWLAPATAAIEGYARAQGCTVMEGHGRRGWVRASGYAELGPMLWKAL